MKRKNIFFIGLLAIVLTLSMLLSACNGGKNPTVSTGEDTTQPTEPQTTSAPTEPETTEAPTEPVTTEPSSSDATETETDGKDNLPETDSYLTVKEAVALGNLLENNQYTEGKYYVTGKIKMIVLPATGKMFLCDDDGNIIGISEAYSEDGELSFGQMSDKPVAGDVITVYGVIGKSGSSVQMKNAWIIADSEEDSTSGDATDAPETTESETDAPETTESETDAPETTESETNAPETTESETDAPETTESETDAPETTESETNAPETTESETDAPETTESETDAPKTTESETNAPETTEGTTHAPVIDEQPTYEIPDDPYEETEGAVEEETLAPGVCPEHPNKFAYDSGYHWYPACETCGRDTASRPLAHTGYGTIEDEGDILLYSYFCKWCGCTISRVEVPYDVNLYLDPMAIGDSEHNYGPTAAKFDSVDGIPSMKFTSETSSGNYVTLYSNDNTTSPTGQWVAMKLKLGNGRSSFTLGVSSLEGRKGASAAKGTDGIVNATFTGLPAGWVTVIVDLSKIVKDDAGYQPNDNGDFYLCRYKFFMNGASALQSGDSYDLAYVAFFDSLDDAKDFTKAEHARYIYEDVLADSHPTTDGTPCQHNYTMPDELHHTYDACEICGDQGGTYEHKYNFINVETFEYGRISQYQVECICGMKSTLKTVPEDINYYTVPSKIHITNAWHGYTHGTVGLEDGDVYQRVYLYGNPANGHGGTVPLITTGDLANFDKIQNGSGKYFLIKLRAHEIQLIALRLANRIDGDLLTVPKDGHPNSHTWTDYADEWVTVVIDLRRLAMVAVPDHVSPYRVDDEAVTSISVGLQCQKTGGESVEGYLDIAYFAVCDTWEQIAEITGKEKVLVTAWAGNAAFAEATTDGNIQCFDHIPKMYVSEDRKTVSYRCAICDNPYETRTFTTDINYYSAPGQQTNSWNSGGLGAGYATPGTLMFDEDGKFVYNHITLEKGGAFEFINGSTAKEVFIKGFDNVHDTIYGGTGKYMVLKMRVGSEEFIKLLAWDGTETTLTSDNMFEFANRSAGLDDDWAVYVIDMEKVFSATYDSENTDINKVTFGMKGDFTDPSTAKEYVDIAYMAICDDWTEVADVVGTKDEVVLLTDWVTPFNDETRKPDGTSTKLPECETHAEIIMESATTNDGTLYRYSCPVCRKVFEERTVSEDINYFAAPSAKIGYNNWNTGKTTSSAAFVGELDLYEDENVIFPYARITIQNGGSFELLNGSFNVTWEQKDFKTVHDTISGGSGNYAVIKMRVGTGAQEFLKMLAWDGVTGAEKYAQGPLSTSKSRTSLSTEWVVYVIDLSKAFPETYTAGNADITKVTFGFQGDGNGGALSGDTWTGYDENDYVDIAYFAVCDDWTEINAIVGDEDVILTDWKTPTNDKNYTSAGKEITNEPCEEHAVIEVAKTTEGNVTTYKYVCPECKHVVDTKTVSGDVNYYVAPSDKIGYNNWNTGKKYWLESYVGELDLYVNGEEAFMYSRVTIQNGGSFELVNGLSGRDWKDFDSADDPISGGSGSYAVIKMRVGTGATEFLKMYAWDGVTEVAATGAVFDAHSRTALSTDWVVYVIDLSKAFADCYSTDDDAVTKVTFGFKGDGNGGSYDGDATGTFTGYDENDYIDIAYFAVCDDWNEIASVVGDENVVLTDWKTPANDKNCTSNGVEITQ